MRPTWPQKCVIGAGWPTNLARVVGAAPYAGASGGVAAESGQVARIGAREPAGTVWAPESDMLATGKICKPAGNPERVSASKGARPCASML